MSDSHSKEPSAIRHIIDELNATLEAEVLNPLVNEQLEKCLLNLSSINVLKVDPKRLLANIKRLLIASSGDSKLDYDLLLELLSKLIAISSFEDILTVFSIEDLATSLNSGIPALVRAANQVISRSYPKGLFANSKIVDILLDLYFDESQEISIINSIERSISNLCSDDLIRRRLMINNFPRLMAVRKKYKPTSMARLLEILSSLCSYMDHTEFSEKLFVIRPEEILQSLEIDIVMFIHILVYYTKVLGEVDVIEVGGPSHNWLLRYVRSIVPTYGQIFAQLEEYSDVKYFARSYLFNFFRKLSYLEDSSIFRELDDTYIHLSPASTYLTDFLSFVNPAYLFEYHPTLITRFSELTPSKLGVIRNLVADPACFAMLKDHFTAESILAMPYMEQMVLLQRFSQFSHSSEYLLHELPKVMSNLISAEDRNITESETVALRRESIENLLKYEDSVWHISLKNELIKIQGGRPRSELHADIASSYI
ncbi:hypothetical protein HG536_0F02120 [Torulaspora globosa]|uniref:DNA mismatch repair protein HSM3 n=1 Tax=Torulaspora globosa TaxID=48254 RepID=A0A7G3ZK51_9SACH|nr:uncharacterized protein HG536_0F02120 [Torulaspora globosa]QLL33887.1 hypothetical protein HG536_0F02120 [Torulaspora globosa]